MYAIQGRINGQTGFAVQPFNQTEKPVVQCSSGTFQATLFPRKEDAERVMDELKHGIAKCCRIVSISINEMADPAK